LALFTKSFYNRVSMCFAHIAHYCRSQFYDEWFSSLAAQVRFLKHTLRFRCFLAWPSGARRARSGPPCCRCVFESQNSQLRDCERMV
jgi:hypothetical protein